MGRRGPAPTSKRELESRGSWRAKDRPDDLTLEVKPPKPPSNLSREAKAEWKRIVKALGPKRVLTDVDRAGLTMLCELWAEDRDLGKTLAKLMKGSSDWARVFRARQDVRKLLKDMLARFGLTPADRPRVKPGEPEGQKGSSGSSNEWSKPNPKPRLVG